MNPIIVVEGTTDFTKIKQVGYKYCVKTCGFCVSRETSIYSIGLPALHNF